jgi:hypothetical protein
VGAEVVAVVVVVVVVVGVVLCARRVVALVPDPQAVITDAAPAASRSGSAAGRGITCRR